MSEQDFVSPGRLQGLKRTSRDSEVNCSSILRVGEACSTACINNTGDNAKYLSVSLSSTLKTVRSKIPQPLGRRIDSVRLPLSPANNKRRIRCRSSRKEAPKSKNLANSIRTSVFVLQVVCAPETREIAAFRPSTLAGMLDLRGLWVHLQVNR